MANFFKKLLFDEVPADDQGTPQKVEVLTPLVTNTNAPTKQQPQQAFTTDGLSGNMFAPAPVQPVISDKDKALWQKYFSDLYDQVKTKTNYGQFLANIETVMETDNTLADTSKFKMAFSFMKKQGITKEMLLASINEAIAAVENDRKAVFEVDVKSKQDKITSNNNLINEKQLAMQKLQDEIVQLKTSTEETKNKIATKTLCYNALSNQLLTKIKNDITGVNNFIV